ncbi:MAG TPA: NAD(P)H-hydrate dehydratase [Candidatus Magasanikbacteria bacterium]|nr:MAG: NAD(P)H-hydrate dehydratase [Candidatus Magasanikbacteria bacterium RIFCSPLOWO2_02_FULL_47_16]OGH80086.1 MAG: NAD(P)H-hydrate dehydratase [Candidatus Magasanikbacteria bacterium RIFCSPHIGHO2_02_FULL_48_18]OGH83329.1 MAG: NAD(P)H-hydrate dehydratase [Candidatus Magasanikbacteria bacterium RIFCSPLOWO2_12_FULL_47_9b]HAZ28913.1 NAD(P)H-hydrate dehydratase [Candidatus Magasanikbacteria bacterium]
MNILDHTILERIARPLPMSHKGQNGRLLIIAGSDTFHGALVLTVEAASRLVDMVYVHSTKENLKLIQKLRQNIATFIAVSAKKLWEVIELVDVIAMGPGLPEDEQTIALVHDILEKYPNKKIIVDATALWHVEPGYLHKNCILTPHSREFENVFHCDATKENVQKMAQQYACTIVLTGATDYISDGAVLFANTTGNVGMTKGGTGDVLVGLIAGLYTVNETLVSALAGTYLNGFAGDRLHQRVGTFFNAEDLIQEAGRVWGEQEGGKG